MLSHLTGRADNHLTNRSNTMPLTANRVASAKLIGNHDRREGYNLVVVICFAVLLTVEITRCFSPLLAAVRYRVERTTEWYSLPYLQTGRTTEWYSLPTVTSNWHTVKLIGSLAALLWQHSLRSWLPLATLFNLSPNLNLYCLESDPDQRFS